MSKQELLDAVWQVYSPYSPGKLSGMTHMPGTPWDTVVNKRYGGRPPRGIDIEPDLIREYFSALKQRREYA